MDKIINILTENRLFNDRPSDISVNKIDDFLKNYEINPGSYNPFPNNIKRNNDGYIILNELPYIISDFDTNTRNESFWMILENGSRIFVKDCDYFNEMEHELLFQELAKILNIPCASYDIALLNDKKYLISNSFLGIDDFIYDYYNLERYKKQYYVDIEKLLIDAKKINQDLFLRKTLTIDGLVKNVDRFPRNFRTIISNGENRICPLFDNGLKDKATITETFIGTKSSFDSIIEYLIQDKNYLNWLKSYVLNQRIPNIKRIIEQEKKIIIDDNTYDIFEENLYEGKKLIKTIINS